MVIDAHVDHLADDTLHAILAVDIVAAAVTLVDRLDERERISDGNDLEFGLLGILDNVDILRLAAADKFQLSRIGRLGLRSGEDDVILTRLTLVRLDGQPGRNGGLVDLPIVVGDDVDGILAALDVNGHIRLRNLNLGKSADLLLHATGGEGEKQRCDKISEFHIRKESD